MAARIVRRASREVGLAEREGERLARLRRSGPFGESLHHVLQRIWVAGRQAVEGRRARAVLRGLRPVSPAERTESFAWFRERGPSATSIDEAPVTVVITCHDDAGFLPELLGSLRRQSLQSFPVVVVDGASRDPESRAVLDELERHQGRWSRVLRLESDVGLPAVRNRALSLVTTPFATCVDADDLLGADFLAKTVARLERRSELGFVYFDYYMFGAREEHVRTPDFDFEFLLQTNYIVASAPFRLAAWQAVGGYREDMVEGYEDWELWLRLAKSGWHAERIPETLFYYRRLPRSMIARLRPKHDEWTRFLREQHPELPWPSQVEPADLRDGRSHGELSRSGARNVDEG